MRIFQRLRDEQGYDGRYDQVRRYVRKRRRTLREAHLLLDHPPGSRLECGFGHVQVDFHEGRRPVPVLLAVSVDAGAVRAHVDEVVRGTVEQTLNALLDAEAKRACGAARYERSPDRQDTRAGSYARKLQTKAGEVTLTVPRPSWLWRRSHSRIIAARASGLSTHYPDIHRKSVVR